jgi:hypothetical protein
LHLRVDYKCNYKKIKEKNNINNNKYVWEVEFRGGKSREKYRSKVRVPKSKDPAQGPIARSKRCDHVLKDWWVRKWVSGREALRKAGLDVLGL